MRIGNWILHKITVHYETHDDTRWLLHETGDMAHPVAIFSEYEFASILEQYEAFKVKPKPKPTLRGRVRINHHTD